MKVNPQLVMALRKLTDQPLSVCRQALVEANGDIGEVVRRLRGSPCCGLHATDAEIAAVLAGYGVTWAPPEHTPRPVSEAEVVAELEYGGKALADYFLLGEMVCHRNTRGVLMATVIEDPDLAAATKSYLRRTGVREFASFEEYRAMHPAS